MLHIISTIVLIVITAGLVARRHRRVHLTLMAAAFVTDLCLLVYIEASRHAVEKVARGVGALLWFHVAISVAMLACYGAMIFLGLGIFRGTRTSRTTHRNIGMAFVVFRLLNYITSFMV